MEYGGGNKCNPIVAAAAVPHHHFSRRAKGALFLIAKNPPPENVICPSQGGKFEFPGKGNRLLEPYYVVCVV